MEVTMEEKVLRFEAYKEAKDRLMKEYYADFEVWKLEGQIMSKYPIFPTHKKIEDEAIEVYNSTIRGIEHA